MFFASIDWEKLLACQIKPPWIPQINDPLDTSLFDQEFTRMPVKSLTPPSQMGQPQSILARSQQIRGDSLQKGTFDGFSYYCGEETQQKFKQNRRIAGSPGSSSQSVNHFESFKKSAPIVQNGSDSQKAPKTKIHQKKGANQGEFSTFGISL